MTLKSFALFAETDAEKRKHAEKFLQFSAFPQSSAIMVTGKTVNKQEVIIAMLVFENESAAINNAVYEVHKRLGVGLQESLYQEALAIELDYQCIPFEREKRYHVYYRGQRLDHYYFADFVCFDKIILEVKAVSQLTDQHKAQVRNYIGIAEKRLGMLYNFNEKFMTPVRILNSNLRDFCGN